MKPDSCVILQVLPILSYPLKRITNTYILKKSIYIPIYNSMNSSLLWMFILIAISVLIILLCFKSGLFGNGNKNISNRKKPKGEPKSNCPICNSPLYQGENVISRVYKGSDKTDQACTIMGCPHCFPKLEPGVERICPVCHKNIPLNGHLDAHLFFRDTGKRHVHITGCTECHKKK